MINILFVGQATNNSEGNQQWRNIIDYYDDETRLDLLFNKAEK